MNIKSGVVLKKIFIGLALIFLGLLSFSLILNFAITIMEQKENVIRVGETLEGFGSYFIGMRLALVVIIIFYWKEIIRWYGKKRRLTLKQLFVLKMIHPYIVGLILMTEVLGFAFRS